MTTLSETPGTGSAQDVRASQRSRRPLIIVLLTAIALLVIAVPAYLLVHGVRSNDLDSQIDARVSALGLSPAPINSILDKAITTRRAIVAGNLAAAGETIGAMFKASQFQGWRFYPYSEFIDDILVAPPPELGAQLDEWVAKDATSASALLLRAKHGYDQGWATRGHNFSAKTASDRMTAFADNVRAAFADANAAQALAPADPYIAYLRLEILGAGGPSPALKAAFDDAIAKFPGYYPLYDNVLETLQPRWGGTTEAMTAFVDQYAGNAPQYSPLKLLYLDLYYYLLSTAETNCAAAPGGMDEFTACIPAFMSSVAPPSLEQKLVDALSLYDHTDKYQFGRVVKDIVSNMLAVPGTDTYSGAVLQLAATAMHSDTQLKQENAGHNDYVIDELVAQSWSAKKFPDNASAKYNDALADVRNGSFPSEEDRNAALGSIYDTLANAASNQKQYVDEIAFKKAAILVGWPWDADLVCHGYLQLKAYDQAIDACSDALASADTSRTWYWRGEAYTQTNQPDLALADLKRSADHDDSYFSPYAAVDMSMVYFNRKDNAGALQVLNDYPSLYDPNRTAKDQVAVAYNNRCYAYMQLGELQKALDDCTQSLKYGSIPDAFRKQQELVARLKPAN